MYWEEMIISRGNTSILDCGLHVNTTHTFILELLTTTVMYPQVHTGTCLQILAYYNLVLWLDTKAIIGHGMTGIAMAMPVWYAHCTYCTCVFVKGAMPTQVLLPDRCG